MGKEWSFVGIAMVRPSLRDLLQVQLPAPYRFRSYEPGDVAAWVRIHELADPYAKATPELFAREFGDDREALSRRQLYLCDGEGEAVGTITAWTNAHYPGMSRGRVHWVAIIPAHQGGGLGKPLLAACLRRMAALGYEGAYLTTDTRRVPAVNLYLRFGFLPDIRNDVERGFWGRLARQVKPEFRPCVEEAVAEFAGDHPRTAGGNDARSGAP